MRVFDVHVHIQPWEMLKPEGWSMLSYPSHADAKDVLTDPMPIDDVAIDFPRLPIILAHTGRPLHGETAFFLARRHANVRLDVSGIPPKSLPRYVPRIA